MDCRSIILANSNVDTPCKRKGVACGAVEFHEGGFVGPDYGIRWFHNGPIGRDETLCSGERGNCGCIHAEQRALEFCIREHAYYSDEPRFALLVNYSPCTNCANMIVASMVIDRVYFITMTEHDKRGVRHLQHAGIEVVQL